MVFLTTEKGHPRSAKAFGNWFVSAARAAGLVGLSAHGLRKYRMNALAEGGASVLQMQSWVGHVTLEEVQRYTSKADRRRALLGGEQEQNPVNSPEKIVTIYKKQ